MDKPQFDDCFKAFDKATDRVRSVVYVFIVVYIAMLFYAIAAFAYPERQFLYDAASHQARCFYDGPTSHKSCDDVKAALADLKEAPAGNTEIQRSLWTHKIQLFYDNSVALRTFKFPILGLETDRDLLWAIFPLIGLIGYCIVWSALNQMAMMFEFLVDENKGDPMRIRLVQWSLMITTPLRTGAGGLTPVYQMLWQTLALFVFFIPIVVSALILADQTNLIPTLRGLPDQHFMSNLDGLAELRLSLGMALLLLQLGLFLKLVQRCVSFGTVQYQADRIVTLSRENSTAWG